MHSLHIHRTIVGDIHECPFGILPPSTMVPPPLGKEGKWGGIVGHIRDHHWFYWNVLLCPAGRAYF